jgi:hypothetical protein
MLARETDKGASSLDKDELGSSTGNGFNFERSRSLFLPEIQRKTCPSFWKSSSLFDGAQCPLILP